MATTSKKRTIIEIVIGAVISILSLFTGTQL